MKAKLLAEANFRILAVLDGDDCPAESFMFEGEAATHAYRSGLLEMIGHIAEKGLQGVPAAWCHEADKAKGVYELIKGPLRLFFFKGSGKDIAICTSGVRKSGQKADKSAVNKAAGLRADYFSAIEKNTFKVIEDETE